MPDPFELTVVCEAGKSFAPRLRRQVHAARKLLRGPLRELSLVLANDATMSDLHRRFMNDPTTTDVLTFPLAVNKRGRATSGEVYVCVPEARRRAREHGTRVADELLLYALHGMLHLCGFDDRTPAGFERMHRTEDRILTRIGVGAVFQPQQDRSQQRNERQHTPLQHAPLQRTRRREARRAGASAGRVRKDRRA